MADESMPSDEWNRRQRTWTLRDVVAAFGRRRRILVAIVAASLAIGMAVLLLTPAAYESQVTLVAIDESDIIVNWLRSRTAAKLVVEDMYDSLEPEFGAGSVEDAAARLQRAVYVHQGSNRIGDVGARLVTLVVELRNPVHARDVASAYLDSLSQLRPQLENVTAQDAFDRYYFESRGSPSESAVRDAAVSYARNKTFWIILDPPVIPASPASPQFLVVVGSALVGGILIAGIVALALESRHAIGAKRDANLPAKNAGPARKD